MPAEVIAQTGPGAVAPTPKAAPTAAAPAAPPAKSPEVAALELKLAEEQKRARIMLQRQSEKLTNEAKREREGLGSKLGRLTELEKMHAQAKMNPEAFLKGVYGDDWYDRVVSAKLNNGVPTADVLASEIAKVEEKFEAKFKARDEEAKTAAAEAERASVAQSRHEQVVIAGEFWAEAAKDYPLVSDQGTAEQIAGEIARRREAHYDATVKRDENGQFLAHGQILPLQKVLESWEGRLVKIAERAAGHEKYAAKFQPKPAVAAPKDAGQQRRTLSNDLTGSTPQRSAPANDSERRARAIAAYEAKSKPTL